MAAVSQEILGRRRMIDTMCVGVADALGRGRGWGSVWLAIVWGHQGNASSGWTRLAAVSQEILGRRRGDPSDFHGADEMRRQLCGNFSVQLLIFHRIFFLCFLGGRCS